MNTTVDVFGPDGKHVRRHPQSQENGRIEVRQLGDGSGFEVLGVNERNEVRRGAEVIRAARRKETVLGTYPGDHEARPVADR